MSADLIMATVTTLDEIAEAISELNFRRQRGELAWPELDSEQTALTELFRRRVEGDDSVDSTFLCGLVAMLILEGMVAQHQHDLRLAAQSLPPFGKE